MADNDPLGSILGMLGNFGQSNPLTAIGTSGRRIFDTVLSASLTCRTRGASDLDECIGTDAFEGPIKSNALAQRDRIKSNCTAANLAATGTCASTLDGLIAPSGTSYYSLNATPTYTFTANAGYHVSAVTVDGSPVTLAGSYTFGAISANHTIDVQFTVNPAVSAIANLSATQVRTGNDADGTTKITLAWSGVPSGSTVEVWRKGYGNYPEYDDGASPGSIPSAPSAYPPTGWTLTSVSASGQTDEPSSRDFYYYVAYVTDQYGTRSDV